MSSSTRRQKLDIILSKRLPAFEYLKHFFQGDTFWMQSVYFSKLDVKKIVSTAEYKSKCLSFFMLGISLSKLNDGFKSGQTSNVFAFLQLLEEWEYHFASPHTQAIKYLMARNSTSITPQSIFTTKEPEKISIYKYNSEVVYEFLLTPHLPFDLSFLEVLSNLCDEFTTLYEIFHTAEFSYNVAYFDAIVRADNFIQTYILDSISKDITEDAYASLKHEIDALRIGAGVLL